VEKSTAARTGGALATALVIACLAILGLLLWRSYQDQAAKRVAAPPPAPEAPAPAAPPPAAPEPPAPILAGRTDLLAAAEEAAALHAQGAGAPAPSSGLNGRRFRVRLPFGCAGASAVEPAQGSYFTIGGDAQTLRIVVRPEVWTGSPLVGAPEGQPQPEAVVGFWLSRPWLRSETCPPPGADPLAAEAARPSPETVGLAMFYEADASRAARSDSPAYETVVNLEPGRGAPSAGLWLVLEGRVTGFGDGRAFRCRSDHPDQRPVCVARVQIDSLAVEAPGGRAPLATWEIGPAAPTAR